MKRILLPTDFSPISLNAIEYALEMFKDVPCQFYLLNVFRIPYLTNEELMDQNAARLSILEDEMYDDSINALKELKAGLPKNDKHEFITLSDYNLFSLAVKQVVQDKKIDMVIMGTKGATGAKEIFVGSNTSDVIMRNYCHVVAVPEQKKFRPPKEITFPTDFKIAYDANDLEPLLDLAAMNDATIRIVHFSDNETLDELQTTNKEKLEAYLENTNHSYHILSNSDFEEGINCFTQSRGDIDILVIISRHYSFFERLLFKPKVKSLSFHSKIPLFVIHHQTD